MKIPRDWLEPISHPAYWRIVPGARRPSAKASHFLLKEKWKKHRNPHWRLSNIVLYIYMTYMMIHIYIYIWYMYLILFHVFSCVWIVTLTSWGLQLPAENSWTCAAQASAAQATKTSGGGVFWHLRSNPWESCGLGQIRAGVPGKAWGSPRHLLRLTFGSRNWVM